MRSGSNRRGSSRSGLRSGRKVDRLGGEEGSKRYLRSGRVDRLEGRRVDRLKRGEAGGRHGVDDSVCGK